MTRIDWLEVDGKRVLESKAARFTEYRCDACGEFVAEPVILQMQIFPFRVMAASLPQYHLHPECLTRCLPFIQDDLRTQGVRLDG